MSFHWKRFWNLNTLGSSSLAKRMIHKFWTHLTLRPAGARYRALCKIVLNKRTTNPASREQIASQIRRNGSTRSCSVTALTPEDFWGNPRVANGKGQAGQLLSSLEQIAIPISRQLWRVFLVLPKLNSVRRLSHHPPICRSFITATIVRQNDISIHNCPFCCWSELASFCLAI